MACPKLIVGSLVSFTSKTTRAFFEGRVYFYRPEDANFGIDRVSRTFLGSRNLVDGCYQFSLNEIEDLRVIPAVPKSTNDQKNNPGDASSSSTLPSKCVSDEKYLQAITKSEDVQIFQKLTSPDYMSSCLCLMFLDEPQGVASILEKLFRSESNDDSLLAFQIAFYLLDKGQNQSFPSSLIDRLPAPLTEAVQASKLQVPPEIRLEILARVPKRRYPIFYGVSKEFMNLLKSREIHILRRRCDQDCIYLCFNTSNPTCTKAWFALRNDNQRSEDVFRPAVVIPHDHEWFQNAQSFANIYSVGPQVFFVGRRSSPKLWIFDHTSSIIREGPRMPVLLQYRNAGVAGNKLYFFGAETTSQTLRERYRIQAIKFDIKSQTWSEPFPTSMVQSLSTESLDNNLYLIKGPGVEHRYYNTADGTLTTYREPYMSNGLTWLPSAVCVKDNVLYSYDTYHGLFWYEAKKDRWKEVSGLTLVKIRDGRLKGIRWVAMKEYYGKLALLWTDEEVSLNHTVNVWCSLIDLERTSETEIRGVVEPFKVVGNLPSIYELTHCVSVSS